MERRDYDDPTSRLDLKFWAIVASQDIQWVGHCEHLTEQATRQLEAWGIADTPLEDF